MKKNVLRDSAAMIQDFYQVFEGPQVPKGEVYRAIEVPKGEMGVYIRSEGGAKPARVRFSNPELLPRPGGAGPGGGGDGGRHGGHLRERRRGAGRL